MVFPTHVGVFLNSATASLQTTRLPHACGGVSAFVYGATISQQSSPRMWGCFQAAVEEALYAEVFPTHVGVFPMQPSARLAAPRLPHACGGVSDDRPRRGVFAGSSPRMWGCFLFPAWDACAR